LDLNSVGLNLNSVGPGLILFFVSVQNSCARHRLYDSFSVA